MKQLLKTTVLVVVFFMYQSCSKDGSNSSADTARANAVKDYNEMYLASSITTSELAWTGNVGACIEGTISQAALDKCILRLNYFRKICGLSYNITLNPAWLADNQRIALMCSANNALSHTPPTTWSCYTAAGAASAGKSNLALGLHSANAITGWMQDYGTGNEKAGHRRWILFSRALQFGMGSTNNAAAMQCIDDSHLSDPLPFNSPEYVSYPPKYIPQTLAFPRWSFSVLNPSTFFSGIDFSGTTLKVTGPDGTSLPINVISRTDNGYGDQTIVWEPSGVNTNSTSDLKYHVTLENVKVNGTSSTYNYDVNIIKP